MCKQDYNLIHSANGTPIKMWTNGVDVTQNAIDQLKTIADLPFIEGWVSAMPDVHAGSKGATIGSVIPTVSAVIPGAVGRDIGCGMSAVKTSLNRVDLPEDLKPIRSAIENAVPHGIGEKGQIDKGAWSTSPKNVQDAWKKLEPRFKELLEFAPQLAKAKTETHLGTLGTGNHFIEVCTDENQDIWIMLHSGSRGPGRAIGDHFSKVAQNLMKAWYIELPDKNLAYIPKQAPEFRQYMTAMNWAQDYARINREIMMENTISSLKGVLGKEFNLSSEVINCHHNYIAYEHHQGKNILITRKGTIRARKGDRGIIPGSMGARSYIVTGKGDPESFHSASHGAGRQMTRKEAQSRFTLIDHFSATEGIECRKDIKVIDETPQAYKDIDKVMEAQKNLVSIDHTLSQIVCVKG